MLDKFTIKEILTLIMAFQGIGIFMLFMILVRVVSLEIRYGRD